MSQPHNLLLLVLALELDHPLAVVLHREDIPLVLDPRVLVDPDLISSLHGAIYCTDLLFID